MFINPHCMQVFGIRLKEIRKRSGLSQETLAKELGISKGALSYYENGERVPDINFLEKVSLYYNVSLDYLMGFSNAMNPEKSSVVDRTGLSEEAVDILMNEYDGDCNSNILDKLIKSNDFRKVLSILECESHSDMGARIGNWDLPLSLNDVDPSYLVFVLEKMLLSAIAGVLEERSGEISEKIFNTLLTKQEREKYYSWLCDPAHTDELMERMRKLDEEREARMTDSIRQWREENSVRYDAVRKLHNAGTGDNKKKDGENNGKHNPS